MDMEHLTPALTVLRLILIVDMILIHIQLALEKLISGFVTCA